MSATITNGKILAVTGNAFHIRNNELVVTQIEAHRKVYRERDTGKMLEIKSTLNSLFVDAGKGSLEVTDTVGKSMVTSVSTTRSSEEVTVIMPEFANVVDANKAGFNSLLDAVAPLILSKETTIDYVDPSQDSPKFNLNGEFGYDDNGATFTVSSVEVL